MRGFQIIELLNYLAILTVKVFLPEFLEHPRIILAELLYLFREQSQILFKCLSLQYKKLTAVIGALSLQELFSFLDSFLHADIACL